jgi:XTP/dITP diphosphohydrolase
MISMREAGIDFEVVEDGKTFQENALKKAKEIFELTSADAVLADDSGLMVDALGGAPGVYSARFSGEGHDDEANNKKLLELMENVPEEQRTCRFASAVALAR